MVTLSMMLADGRHGHVDAGSIAAMVGGGMLGGGFVLACGGYGARTMNARFKAGLRSVGPTLFVVGVVLLVVGLLVHHR